MRDLAFSLSNFAARRRRDRASIAPLRFERPSAGSIERAIVGTPPRILLRRRFPGPPIAPEFQTRRLARVLYRSESSNCSREVAFRPNSNRLRVRYALSLSFRFSMASSARKRPRCEVPATPGRVPCPCNTCIPDACFPPELSLPHSGIRSEPFPACRVRITDACFCAIDTVPLPACVVPFKARVVSHDFLYYRPRCTEETNPNHNEKSQ